VRAKESLRAGRKARKTKAKVQRPRIVWFNTCTSSIICLSSSYRSYASSRIDTICISRDEIRVFFTIFWFVFFKKIDRGNDSRDKSLVFL
jgi:hypothetical protein